MVYQQFFRCQSCYQLFCYSVMNGSFHHQCKIKSCPDQVSNLGYCGHNAVSQPLDDLDQYQIHLFSHLCSRVFSLSEMLPVILLFRHGWLFPSPVQKKILSRPGFETGLLLPQRSVLTTRRSGPMSKPFFLVIVLLESFSVVRVATSYSVAPS